MLRGPKSILILSGILACTAGGVARADMVCSNATLNGEYSYGVVNFTPPGLPNGPAAVVAGIKYFDGKGGLIQHDYHGDSLRLKGISTFADGETGTYTVGADCTGTMKITITVPGIPTGTIQVAFVIADGGRHIHEVIAQITPPGYTTPQPAQIYADDWKVEPGR
jgi:hypothetical protein